MPDLDRIERTLPPEWRPAYKLLKGGQPTEEIAKAILAAIAKDLRKRGGAEGIDECAEAVQRHDSGLLSKRSLAAAVDELERRMESRNGKLLATAALRPGVSGPASILRGPADERLCFEFLERMVEAKLFSQTRYLVGKRFPSLAAAIQSQSELLHILEPELRRLAKRLARDPSAKSLKAPAFRGAERKTTGQLLHEEL